MDVESLAVSKINSMVARCAHLKAFISVNDKTPFTDGHIDLYEGVPQSKATWRGRVSVQVKGRTAHGRKSSTPTHSIPRTDLLAYQADSGVLFFYVTVSANGADQTAYYAILSPFSIEAILNGGSNQQASFSIPMKKLPSTPRDIQAIVGLALKTREQHVSQGFDPLLLEHLASFTVHTASPLDLKSPVTLTSGVADFALVLNTSDGLSIPVGGELQIFPHEYVQRYVDVPVGSGGVVYDGAKVQRLNPETVEIVLSEGLRLVFETSNGNQVTTAHLVLEKTLGGRLKSIEFFTALLDTHAVEIDGVATPFSIVRTDEHAGLRAHLEGLSSLGELFARLGVDTTLIQVDHIDEAQRRQLSVLYRAFVRGEEIVDPSARISRVVQTIGQWELMFLILEGSTQNSWRLIDPFTVDVRQQFSWNPDGSIDERVPVTAYDIVEPEHVGRVLNMRLDSIVGAYEAIADCPRINWLANERVLALISAADCTPERSDCLLEAADTLNNWLLTQENGEPHHLINHWQISWRRGELSVDERHAIRQLKRNSARAAGDTASVLEVACALLLGEAEEVEDLLASVSSDDRRNLARWPIWRLRDSAQ